MRTRRVFGLLCLAAFVVGGSARVMAEDTSPSRSDAVLRKLGRGIANVVTCPLELIRVPSIVSRKDGYFAAMTVGILQGAWKTLVRAGAGVFEVVTFYAEIPKGYAPLVIPEFVWQHGNWVE